MNALPRNLRPVEFAPATPFVTGAIVAALIAGIPTRALAPCSLPDLPTCACYTTTCAPVGGPWPLNPGIGNLIEGARAMVNTRSCCIQHGGQAYWQIQRQAAIPEAADALAFEDPDIETDDETKPGAWCTETIAFWGERANVPYSGGYYTERHHPSSYVTGGREMRQWYEDEEAIGGLARGRWIDGSELDYENFEPGVNGPCPGAYQQIYGFDRTDPDGNGNVWNDSTAHSQLIDSMVVHRFGAADGPVQRIDVHMVEGNIGFGGGSIYSRVIDTRWYRDIHDFTVLGPDDEVLDSNNRKIRGWGINIDAGGNVRCDSDRIKTVVVFSLVARAAPTGPENSDSVHVAQMLSYYTATGGNVVVSSNSTMVQTGGALPTETNPWVIPQGPHPVDPVYIDVDLLDEHPVRVRAVTFDWVEAIPRQFQVWWSPENVQIKMRSVSLPSGPPTVPPGTALPLTVAFNPAAPDTGYPVRYIRLCIPNAMLTRTFAIRGLHYNFHYTDVEDNGGSSPEGDAGPPTGVGGDPIAPPSLRLAQAAPNPFGPSTRVGFQIPGRGAVRLAIYDVRGRTVKVLVRDALGAGDHHATWDGRDERGREVPTGVYFVRLEWRGQGVTRKIVRVR